LLSEVDVDVKNPGTLLKTPMDAAAVITEAFLMRDFEEQQELLKTFESSKNIIKVILNYFADLLNYFHSKKLIRRYKLKLGARLRAIYKNTF
jgi:hypothetical protein